MQRGDLRWLLLIHYAFFWLLPSLGAQEPHWIWPAKTRVANSLAKFQRTFDVTGPVHTATLSGIADFCSMSVKINDQSIVSAEPFRAPFQLDVGRYVREGNNLLEVEARSVSGPAAVSLRLELDSGPAKQQLIVSDSGW